MYIHIHIYTAARRFRNGRARHGYLERIRKKKISFVSCSLLSFFLSLWRLILSNASKFSIKKKEIKKVQASSFSWHYYKHVLRLKEVLSLSLSVSLFWLIFSTFLLRRARPYHSSIPFIRLILSSLLFPWWSHLFFLSLFLSSSSLHTEIFMACPISDVANRH